MRKQCCSVKLENFPWHRNSLFLTLVRGTSFGFAVTSCQSKIEGPFLKQGWERALKTQLSRRFEEGEGISRVGFAGMETTCSVNISILHLPCPLHPLSFPTPPPVCTLDHLTSTKGFGVPHEGNRYTNSRKVKFKQYQVNLIRIFQRI